MADFDILPRYLFDYSSGAIMLRAQSTYPPGPVNFSAAIGLTWRHAVAYWWNPLRFLTRMGSYGDLAFFRLFNYRAYLVNCPELICEVLIDRRHEFVKWDQQIRPLHRTIGHSLLTSEGPRWAEQRRLMQRAFTQAAVSRYAAVAAEESQREFDQWSPASRVDVEPLLSDLLMRISLKSLFGISQLPETVELARGIRHLSDSFRTEMFEPDWLPEWLPFWYKRRKREAVQAVRNAFTEIFAAAHQSSDVHVGSVLWEASHSTDLPRVPEALQAEGLTLMIAGYHTTSEMLLWSTRMLATYPDVQARVAEEIQSDPEAIGQQTDYLDRVLKESLRLYPAAWALFAPSR